MKHARRFLTHDGFTLLEVMVAIGILAISLTGLFAVQGGSMELAGHSKYLTVATLLARSKMIDVEEKLIEEGFSDFAEEDTGDFEEEGWPEFRWRMEMTKVRMPVPSSMPGSGDGSGSAQNAQANNALAAGSSFLTDLIANSMRECNVEVLWDEGGEEQVLKVSTHYINTQNLATGTFASSSGSSSSDSSDSSSSGSTGLGSGSKTNSSSKTGSNPFTRNKDK